MEGSVVGDLVVCIVRILGIELGSSSCSTELEELALFSAPEDVMYTMGVYIMHIPVALMNLTP